MMMNARELEHYLREQIPLAAAMDIRIKELSPKRVTITTPLTPNINHQKTAFGGSVVTLAILAGWSMVHYRLRGSCSQIVIKESRVSYLKPIEGEFEAVCNSGNDDLWVTFQETLASRGKARITLSCEVISGGQAAANFEGKYVAIKSSE